MQLDIFKKLLAKDKWSDAEKVEIKKLKSDFEKMAEVISPLIVGEFQQIMIQNTEKLNSL